jgi:hypothetical protein
VGDLGIMEKKMREELSIQELAAIKSNAFKIQ